MRILEQPLQFDRPLFVRIPFGGRGKAWKAGDHFPWKELSIPEDRVYILYRERFLIHNEEAEGSMDVGDGLETLDEVGLKQLVDDYNKRIKAVTPHETAYNRRKMKYSTLRSRQIGLIRQWRRSFEDWLVKAEANLKNK